MATAGLIPMPIEDLSPEALLTLMQWLSPSYPVGAFSYSHGLEWAVQAGDVFDVDSFQDWLSDIIQHGAGRNDVILLAAAYGAQDKAELLEVDTLARALSPSRERLMETADQGAAFVRVTSDIWGLDMSELTFAVSVGAASSAAGFALGATARLFLQAFAGNLVSAAIRLVPLGQTEGQRCLASLSPLCLRTVEQALGQGIDDLGSCTFLADIASMKHETQYSRLFRS